MNGTDFILWTTEQGGYFKATKGDRAQYDDAVATGTLKIPRPDTDDGKPDEIRFYFIAFGPVVDNYDRGLGCSRDDRRGLAMAAARRH